MYERLQNLLKLVVGKSDYYENKLIRILDFYAEDFCEEKIRSQLEIFSARDNLCVKVFRNFTTF